jgi:hypothetical protein
MIRFLIYLPFFLLMRVITFPLAPIVVAFFRDGYKLKAPFKWMDTNDYDLRGDGGHQERWPDYTSYKAMVIWMWRNGGHDISYGLFGMPRNTYWFWSVDTTPGWQWRMGWNPNDFKNDRSKYNFTVRYRK